MGSEVEIPETPNWLKELEAKRERRLRTKLGHELGAGSPCLTCGEKCPGLDLHFWRKICKNCKCSKENHEVQDDDIYGWAQDELLGTKVNRLKQKIKLPGRKDEVELEWAPTGQKETIDKYLKTLPPELLPIKGSQAAQDRKQLLKKQIPIHDIDPTLCHELTDEELKKMQEYVAHIKQSSVGVGHLIQITFSKGKTHVLDKNEAMFLINNIPKGIASSENVLLQSGNNIVPLNMSGNFESNEKSVLENYQPNSLIYNQIDEVNPVYSNLKDNYAKVNDSIKNNNVNNRKQMYNPQDEQILTEDPQFPQTQSIKSLNHPENLYENIPFAFDEKEANPGIKMSNFFNNSNIKNLVPSAFVPVKHSIDKNVQQSGGGTLERETVKELPYPSQFINDQFKYGKNLNHYNPGNLNILNTHQNSAFFEPIKDLRYSPNEITDQSREDTFSNQNPPDKLRENVLKAIKPKLHYPESFENYSNASSMSSGLDKRSKFNQTDDQTSDEALSHSSCQNLDSSLTYQPEQDLSMSKRQMSTDPNRRVQRYNENVQNIGGDRNMFSNFDTSVQFEGESPAFVVSRGMKDDFVVNSTAEDAEGTGKFSQNKVLPHVAAHTADKTYDDQHKPYKIKNLRDLAYSTYDSPPENIQEDFQNLSVKEKLNRLENRELPSFKPNHQSDCKNLNPAKFSMRDQNYGVNLGLDNTQINARDQQEYQPNLAPSKRDLNDRNIQTIQSTGSNFQNPNMTSEIHSRNSAKERFPSGKSPISNYAPGGANTYEDDSHSTYRNVGVSPRGEHVLSNYASGGRMTPGADRQFINRNVAVSPSGQHSLPNYSSRNTYDDDFQSTHKNMNVSPSGKYSGDQEDDPSRNVVFSQSGKHPLPSYAPGDRNVYEDDLQPTYIPIGGVRDIEFEDPEIRVALSRDNDLFEGSAPTKIIPNLTSAVLPSCHYCKNKFEQDELAIAIPERSDAIFHTSCFKCHGCNQILADMFYFYDKETDNVYCGRDYAKIRGIPRCSACDELIFVKEYCLAENSTFHVKHFCCFECDKPLAGQNYVMENEQPVCVPCYEHTKANKCYSCKEVIHPDQQGLQLKDGVHFHATEECFACQVCKKSLFGAKLLFRKDTLYCSHDCYNTDL